jgi:hypothetical protein
VRKLLERCPSCGGALAVTEMRCTACETLVRGRWEPCRFCQLDAETLRFIEVFVKNRGNLREMERELSESYWTLRARLNQAIETLGLETAPGADEPPDPEPPEATTAARLRQEILRQVQDGTMAAADALRQLADLNKE